jgi:flagellar FliL protein
MAKAATLEEVSLVAEETAPPKKGRGKLFKIAGAVLLLAAVGGGTASYFMGQNGHEATGEKAVSAKPPVFIPIEQFTVNLNPEEGEKFLQTAFTLKVTDDAVIDAIKLQLPDVRNRILLLLSSKKSSDISNVEGKQKLAEEIMVVTNQAIAPSFPVVKKAPDAKAKDAKRKDGAASAGPEHAVTNVLFTHFIIQ